MFGKYCLLNLISPRKLGTKSERIHSFRMAFIIFLKRVEFLDRKLVNDIEMKNGETSTVVIVLL